MKRAFDFLCLDERDSPNLSELSGFTKIEIKNIKNRRYFGLCGVIIHGAEYPDLNMAGRRVQFKHSKYSKYQPFHYVEILNNRGTYAYLGKDKPLRTSLTTLLNRLVLKTNFKVIASFIDKQKLALKYGRFESGKLTQLRKVPGLHHDCGPKQINLYILCLKSVISDYCDYLQAHKQRGIIIAEARGLNEDMRLIQAFYMFQSSGVGKYSGKQLREYIVDLLIIQKSQNHLGIQLADLVTYPIYDTYVPDHNIRSDHFIKKESFQSKILNIRLLPR